MTPEEQLRVNGQLEIMLGLDSGSSLCPPNNTPSTNYDDKEGILVGYIKIGLKERTTSFYQTS